MIKYCFPNVLGKHIAFTSIVYSFGGKVCIRIDENYRGSISTSPPLVYLHFSFLLTPKSLITQIKHHFL